MIRVVSPKPNTVTVVDEHNNSVADITITEEHNLTVVIYVEKIEERVKVIVE